jgi:hypothetical protein
MEEIKEQINGVMTLDEAFAYEPEGAEYLRLSKFVKIDGFGDDQGITEFFQIVEGDNKGEYFARYHNRGDLRGHVYKVTKEEMDNDLAEAEKRHSKEDAE